jgi:nucleotide-binding universal stress UspA family protein
MIRPKHILAPTDFSPIAEQAVDYAFELAQTLDATVSLLHVYAIPPFPDGMSFAPNLIAEVARAAADALNASADKRRDSPRLGKVILHMGDPRDVIARVVRELPADLVVMGRHGRRGVRRMMLGSVAAGVLRSVECPVLAVPGRGESAAACV